MQADAEATRAFPIFPDPVHRQSTVILGAGIVGCATAYYLSHSGLTRPDTIHLVESSTELFQSASGKSGGFLASDWFGPATAELGALSFKLHAELAAEHDGSHKWGYSKSTGTSLCEDGRLDGPRGEDWLRSGGSRAQMAGVHEFHGDERGPAWLARRNGDSLEVISEDGGVAQVVPLKLCEFLLEQCLAAGVHLHHPATAVKVSHSTRTNDLSALQLRHLDTSEHEIPCTRLLIAAGAWTPSIFAQLFPKSSLKIPISSLAGHSLLIRSPRWKKEHEAQGCHAIFSSSEDGFSPELFSRVGEEIYVAGLNDASIPLPVCPENAKVDHVAVAQLKKVAEKLLGRDGIDVSDLEVLREGLCFRPVTSSGVPIIAKIKDQDLGDGIESSLYSNGGVYIAAGHGPWGISQGLGTGKVVAEWMEGQPLSADISKLGL